MLNISEYIKDYIIYNYAMCKKIKIEKKGKIPNFWFVWFSTFEQVLPHEYI